MATFPNYLKLDIKGFAREPEDAVLRTEMEGGVAKQALIRSQVAVGRPVTYWVDSKADFDAWHTWFATTIKRGALWFDWTDPYDNVVKSARIVKGSVKEVPVKTTLSMWQIMFRLETLE